jgi:Flp pilus assembly protein TadG
MISRIKQFWRDEEGVAALEVAMLLPVVMILLLGTIDIGNAIVIHKKVMTAASITADLMARGSSVEDAEVDDAWAASRMAIDPYNRALLGLDIASIQFVGSGAVPTVMWRETFNMQPNPNAITRATGLGVQGEGVLVVTARYVYTPVFTSMITEDVVLEEVAVTRGRRSSFVSRE